MHAEPTHRADDLPDAFETRLRAEAHALLTERSRFIFVYAAFLYIGFWSLDSLVAAEHLRLFLWIRLLAAGFSLAVAWSMKTRFGRRMAVLSSFAVMFFGSFGISVMAAVKGGFDDRYYIGNLMVLFVAGLFLPWPRAVLVGFCAALFGGYFAVNAAVHGVGVSAIEPAFFTLGTSAFAMLASLAGERARRGDLLLRISLEKANEDLQALDHAKTQFFANVSHELRTPLMLILGPVETLLANPDTQGRMKLLSAMRTNAELLLRHVNMLLDVAKIEAGRMKCHFEAGNLARVASRLVEAARPYAQRRHLDLRFEEKDGPVLDSTFDLEMMESVIGNLLSNAIKFTPAGGHVVVSITQTEKATQLTVRDTGCGIAPEEHAKIFDRFHQAHGTGGHKPLGTGLGLALVQEIVRQHGGTVAVDSRLAAGATFQVELPLRPVVRERRRTFRRREDRYVQAFMDTVLEKRFEEKSERSTLFADLACSSTAVDINVALGDAPQIEEAGPAGAPHVLLAEDNPELRAFLVSQLAHAYRITAVCSGTDALRLARRAPPALILTDVMMPGMDGIELCRRLRRDSALSCVPIILITAKAGSEEVIAGLSAGADDYVTKPFDVRELLARMAAHLRNKAAERMLHEQDSRLAALGRVAGGVAHDLNSPLQAILGHSQIARALAEAQPTGQEVLEDIRAIETAAERARVMVREVVEFARAGASPLELVMTDLGALVEEVTHDLRAEHEDLGITITLETARAHELSMPVDRLRFRRVIENLLRNAREALLEHCADQEAKNIWVRVAPHDESVVLRVADNGPGISREVADAIFRPFASAQKKDGTGLGLATVWNLVTAHGGTVFAEERPPEGGAAFVVRLPRIPARVATGSTAEMGGCS